MSVVDLYKSIKSSFKEIKIFPACNSIISSKEIQYKSGKLFDEKFFEILSEKTN